jgi:hypothetical protein
METIFYKILHDNKDVVYVGVTTRTLAQRFKEHIKTKSLNSEHYSIIEFDKISHPDISSIEEYCTERKKVAELEQRYIKEELDKGSNLLNVSTGGEWGADILEKLRRENFIAQYGSIAGYKLYRKKKLKFVRFLRGWIRCYCHSKCRKWLMSFVHTRSYLPCAHIWLRSWVRQKTKSRTKCFLFSWLVRNYHNKTYYWLYSFVRNKSYYKIKYWLQLWCGSKCKSKTKYWLQVWSYKESTNKTKYWLKLLIKQNCEQKTSKWISKWISNKSYNNSKRWLFNWHHALTTPRCKRWLLSWARHKGHGKTCIWLRSWCFHKPDTKSKVWLYSWIRGATINRTKKYLQTWMHSVSTSKTKKFMLGWIRCRTINRAREWLNHWKTNKCLNFKLKRWFYAWIDVKYSKHRTKYWLSRYWIRSKISKKK